MLYELLNCNAPSAAAMPSLLAMAAGAACCHAAAPLPRALRQPHRTQPRPIVRSGPSSSKAGARSRGRARKAAPARSLAPTPPSSPGAVTRSRVRRWERLPPELLSLVLLRVPKSGQGTTRLTCRTWRATLDASLTELSALRWPLMPAGAAPARLPLVEVVHLHHCTVDAAGAGFDDLAALPRLRSLQLWRLQTRTEGEAHAEQLELCLPFDVFAPRSFAAFAWRMVAEAVTSHACLALPPSLLQQRDCKLQIF